MPSEISAREFYKGHLRRAPKQDQAALAIRHLGSNSVPYLLAVLTNEDSYRRSSAREFFRRYAKRDLIRSASDAWEGAVLAFGVLGPTARAATPDLARALFNHQADQNFCNRVALALAAVGAQGQEILAEGITSTNARVRRASGDALAAYCANQARVIECLMTAATNYISEAPYFIRLMSDVGYGKTNVVPFLLTQLRGASPVRKAAIEGLGQIRQQGELAVPALRAELRATNTDERIAAIYGLGEFGERENLAISSDLVGFLQSTNGIERLAAIRALGRLRSSARSAVPALVNLVRELETREGEHLLPQLLTAEIRHRFLVPDWSEPKSREGVVANIIEALNGIDSQWTNSLPSELITGPTLEQWRAIGTGVESRCQGLSLAEWAGLSDKTEPRYQGRSLSDWLRQASPGPSRKSAEEAVRAIGTSGIPWLLVWLQSSEDEKALLAYRGFGMLKKEAILALPALIELAQSGSKSTRATAYRCVVRLNLDWETIWPALLPVLHSTEPTLRLESAKFLKDYYPAQAKDAGICALLPPIPEP